MSEEGRLTRLRSLIARLERLPASPESEWMLREARARLVDVETGERPAEMRPRAEDPPPERRREVVVKRPPKPPSEAPARRDQPERPDDTGAAPIGTDGLLWLEDPASEARDDDDPEPRPWRRGLRG
jgi:hypothetical protein